MIAGETACVGDFFAENARRIPDALAVRTAEDSLTWAQLLERADAVALAFEGLGIGRGARVASILENGIPHIIVLTACFRAGIVALPLDPRLGSDDLGRAVASGGPDLVLVRAGDARSVAAPHVIRDAAAFVTSAPAVQRDPSAEGPDGETVALIISTSGTTGPMRGVMLRHRHLVWNARTLAHGLALSADDRVLCALPLAHIFGISAIWLSAACVGAGIEIVPRFSAAAVLDRCEQRGVTVLHGVPTMFALLLAEQRQQRRDLHTLRTGIMAGAFCPPQLVADVRAELVAARVSYGLSEAGPALTLVEAHDDEAIATTSIGRALPGVELRIGADEFGEIEVRGPGVFDGYDGPAGLLDSPFTGDGFLRTGDCGAIDDKGVVRYTGRKRDVIVRGGYKIAPLEVETTIEGLTPWVRACALVGLEDPVLGERICACVELGSVVLDRDEMRATIRALLRGRLADYKLPDVVVPIERFPRTATGKVRRDALRELAERVIAQRANR